MPGNSGDTPATGRVTHKHFDRPDEVREVPGLTLRLMRVGSLTVGLGTAQPGWRWSEVMRKANDEPLCQIHHIQMLLSGRFAVQLEDGEYTEIEPNEVFEVPPGHDVWVLGDEPAVLLDFFGNVGQLAVPASTQRIVTTLLMTDIVASTATASRLGDRLWKQRLHEHDRVTRARLSRYQGVEVKTTGDGFLARFGSARAALECAASIRQATDEISLPVRAGVHTGEVELLPNDIAGVAVHAAARVMALGGPSEIIVSSSTRGFIEDQALRFEPRGRHELKGLAAPLEVFALIA